MCFACLHTHEILLYTYADAHLPLPGVRCCHSHNSAMPLPHPFISRPVSPPTISPFSLPHLPSITHVSSSSERGKRGGSYRCFLRLSPSLSTPSPRPEFMHWRVRGEKTLQVNACDLSKQKPLHTPTALKDAHTHKHTPSRSPGPRGLVLERASFLRLRQRKLGTDRGPGTSASKPQEALVLSLPVEGVGAWGASCLCFHSQRRTWMSVFCVYVCVSHTGKRS